MPDWWAAAASSASSWRPSLLDSPKPPANTTAAPTPARPHSRSTPGVLCLAIIMNTQSTGPAASIDSTHGTPRTSEYFGFTATISPG